jgi:hypothetical protein
MTDKSSVQDRNFTTKHIHTYKTLQRSLWRLSQIWYCLSRSLTLAPVRSIDQGHWTLLPFVADCTALPSAWCSSINTPPSYHPFPTTHCSNTYARWFRASKTRKLNKAHYFVRFEIFTREIFLTNIPISGIFKFNQHVLNFPTVFFT